MEIIKNDESICIGLNVRRIRKEKQIGQTALVSMVQLQGVNLTREALVKIERGVQHIKVSQLKAIRNALQTSYEELLQDHETPGHPRAL
ncbi:MAG: helix-turn-helix transcriptional regulator [Lachnospiraceae bacterium]|jgi:transcriptional regulator with XRE-family HTH domain|nr:helix-turn-helix transcriptional regulator [Lachnospiraceae bacterium]MCI8960612.1 helix-turn-helix transcriptional regulator [Lachnospiraceae bacterium]